MEYWITVWMKRNVKQWMEDVIKELLEAVDQSFRTVLITTMNQQPYGRSQAWVTVTHADM